MDDLLQPQIQESCKLALPNGLKELMYDISREVLRAQPTNLCEFIADYLSALLITRENLRVASRVCDDVCENLCHFGLEGDLRNIGLDHEDIKIVKDVVANYFTKEHVSETNIIRELFSKTEFSEEYLEDVVEAIRTAFKRYQAHNTTIFETSSESDMSESTRAAKYTLNLYRETKPSEQEYEKAAGTIQAAYRAYGVRRYRNKSKEDDRTLPDDISDGRPTKSLRFGSDDDLCSRSTATGSGNGVNSIMTEKTEDIFVSQSATQPELFITDSVTSLAGSLVQPGTKPYTVHEVLLEENENIPETEHTTVDYTIIHHGITSGTIDDSETCTRHSEASIEYVMDLEITTETECNRTYEIIEETDVFGIEETEDERNLENKEQVKFRGNIEKFDGSCEDITESDFNVTGDTFATYEYSTENEGTVPQATTGDYGKVAYNEEIEQEFKTELPDKVSVTKIQFKEDNDAIEDNNIIVDGTVDNYENGKMTSIDISPKGNEEINLDDTHQIHENSLIDVSPKTNTEERDSVSKTVNYETSTVPKTPFHSVTNFDEEDESYDRNPISEED